MKKKTKPKSKLKKRIDTAKKAVSAVKWVVVHKDMIIKGTKTAKGLVDKKRQKHNNKSRTSI